MSTLAESLERDGIAVTEPLYAPEELVVLRAAVDRVLATCSASTGWERWLELVSQVRDPERWDHVFQQTFDDPRLQEVVSRALGAPAEPVWQHLVWRRPGCQLRLPWHADHDTWPERVQTEGGVAVWLALDDSGPEAGGVRYAPGSHRGLGPNPPEPVCPRVPAGASLLHDGQVLHCSGPNTTDSWRRALVLVFTTRRPAPDPAAPG